MSELKVLDMTEEEQARWVFEQAVISNIKIPPWLSICSIQQKIYQDLVYNNSEIRQAFFADLAFRLRDETENFVEGLVDIFEHREGFSSFDQLWFWVCSPECKPIHWIIAALIAKEKK